MTDHQIKTITDNLDRMATAVIAARDSFPADLERIALSIGRLEYRIWQTRKLLDLPDIPELEPL